MFHRTTYSSIKFTITITFIYDHDQVEYFTLLKPLFQIRTQCYRRIADFVHKKVVGFKSIFDDVRRGDVNRVPKNTKRNKFNDPGNEINLNVVKECLLPLLDGEVPPKSSTVKPAFPMTLGRKFRYQTARMISVKQAGSRCARHGDRFFFIELTKRTKLRYEIQAKQIPETNERCDKDVRKPPKA